MCGEQNKAKRNKKENTTIRKVKRQMIPWENTFTI